MGTARSYAARGVIQEGGVVTGVDLLRPTFGIQYLMMLKRCSAMLFTLVTLGSVLALSQVREGNLKVGDPAPDFELKVRGSEQRLRLSDFQGNKPVALVFGSFT